MGRILAVDPGTKRVGLAISDPSNSIALPREVISFDRMEQVLQEIQAIVAEEGVDRIVVGLPLGLSGQAGPAAEQARALMMRLREATGLDVVEWDERLTSVAASRAMRDGGVSAKKQRGKVDKVAAALILQRYLEVTRHSNE